MKLKITHVLLALLAVGSLASAYFLGKGGSPFESQGGYTGETEPLPQLTAAAPWAQAVVERIAQLEQQNAALKETLEKTETRIVEFEEVFVGPEGQPESPAKKFERIERSLADNNRRFRRMDSTYAGLQTFLDSQDVDVEEVDEEEVLKLEDFVHIEAGELNGMPGPHIIFEAVNVHVVNGSGDTSDFGLPFTGLGNLLIGYSEFDDSRPRDRSGSHNLVVGQGHGYSSYGGLLAGFSNTTAAPNASVTGGTENVANGWGSSVTGGSENLADADSSSVTGGSGNRALAQASSVTGGSGNQTTGEFASVTGGSNNEASGYSSSVAGGGESQATARFAAIAGGLRNTLNGEGFFLGGSLSAPPNRE